MVEVESLCDEQELPLASVEIASGTGDIWATIIPAIRGEGRGGMCECECRV